MSFSKEREGAGLHRKGPRHDPADGTIEPMDCLRCGARMELVDMLDDQTLADPRPVTRYVYRCPTCGDELVTPTGR